MSTAPSWEEQNNAYLHRAIAWLRLRLRRLIDVQGGEERAAGPGGLLRPIETPEPAADQVRAAAEEAERIAEAMNPPPALLAFARRFKLSDFEREVLLLCAAVELDTGIAGLCARAHDNPQQAYPTFALALALFDRPAWDVVSPTRPLRYWHALEINQYGAQPLTVSPLRADERVVSFLKGLNYLDDRLARLLSPAEPADGEPLPPSQERAAGRIMRQLESLHPASPPLIQMLGRDGSSKQLVAWHVSRATGRVLYRLPAEALPANLSELDSFIRLWQRERSLTRLALYVDAREAEPTIAEGPAVRVNRVLERAGGLVFLDSGEAWPGASESAFTIDVSRSTPAEQEAEWLAALGPLADGLPARLAGAFNMRRAAIRRIARAARFVDPPASDDDVWDACLAATRPRMDALAQRLEPRVAWDDLVLPAADKELLEQIAGQAEQRRRVYDDWGFAARSSRGLGLSVLFAGESGTGKTMAAEALAARLRLNLYRIDLAGVVSKYIGETEKNLRRLFDAAEDGGAILFFDEADALFGKRGEVKDSHDRWSNMQVNDLLQRMEAYQGVAILATNMKSALDHAFMRRLRFIVKFPFPGPGDRKEIWKRAFPPAAPLAPEGLDYDWLARLSLTGGAIANIALNAAFRAAQQEAPVSMNEVAAAARTELLKLGKSFKDADLHWRPAAGAAR